MKAQSVIEFFGSISETAKALGISAPAVFKWKTSGEVPEDRQYQIELATKGKLRAEKPALRSEKRKKVAA